MVVMWIIAICLVLLTLPFWLAALRILLIVAVPFIVLGGIFFILLLVGG